MKKPLSSEPRFKNFMSELDKVLEQVLWNTQLDVSRLSSDAFERVRQAVAYRFAMIPENDFFGAESSRHFRSLDAQLDAIFQELGVHIIARMMRMRRAAFVLSFAGQAEAISRTIKKKGEKPFEFRIDKDSISKAMSGPTVTGHRLDQRIQLALSRVRRKVMDAVELSRINGDSTKNAIERVDRALPKKIAYKRPPRILKPIKEADGKRGRVTSQVNVILDDEEWSNILQSYKDAELPGSRFDKEPVDVELPGEQDLTEMYSWEIEQEITESLVKSVNDPSSDLGKLAKEYGVTDFMWIAVIDDRTDECCEWRHGLSVSEIRSQLDGDHSDDECEAEVPPAHINCRCRIVPVAEVPDRFEIEDDVARVDEWLDSLREK